MNCKYTQSCAQEFLSRIKQDGYSKLFQLHLPGCEECRQEIQSLDEVITELKATKINSSEIMGNGFVTDRVEETLTQDSQWLLKLQTLLLKEADRLGEVQRLQHSESSTKSLIQSEGLLETALRRLQQFTQSLGRGFGFEFRFGSRSAFGLSTRYGIGIVTLSAMLLGLGIWRTIRPALGAPNMQVQQAWAAPIGLVDSLSSANTPWIHGNLVFVMADGGKKEIKESLSQKFHSQVSVIRAYTLKKKKYNSQPIQALNAKSGIKRWQSEIISIGYLSGDEENLFCLSQAQGENLELISLSTKDGSVQWRFSNPSPTKRVKPSAASSSEQFVAWSQGSVLHVLNKKSGKELWSTEIGKENSPGTSSFLSTPVFAEGLVWAASQQALQAFDPESGKLIHSEHFDDNYATHSAPELAYGTHQIVLARSRGIGVTLLCAYSPSGVKQWENNISSASALLIAENKVYVRSQQIDAYDLYSGEALWHSDAMGCSPLAYANQKLFLADADGRRTLIALNANDGKRIWTADGLHSCGAISIRDGWGFLSGSDGYVHALNLAADRLPRLPT